MAISKDPPMMESDITLGVNVYSTQVVKPTSTIRGDASREIEDPAILTVSHETGKNGRVSSVMIIDDSALVPCNDACSTTPGISNVRGMIKLQYDPTDGRANLDTVLMVVLAELMALLADSALMTKFRNKEH